jgi:hypothetical protein
MTPSDINTILVELGRIATKLDAQQEALTEIRSEVKKTNGRVTELEGREQVDKALINQRQQRDQQYRERIARWVAPAVIGFLVVIGSAATVALLNLDKL